MSVHIVKGDMDAGDKAFAYPSQSVPSVGAVPIVDSRSLPKYGKHIALIHEDKFELAGLVVVSRLRLSSSSSKCNKLALHARSHIAPRPRVGRQ